MTSIPCDHPDLEEFINIKSDFLQIIVDFYVSRKKNLAKVSSNKEFRRLQDKLKSVTDTNSRVITGIVKC